MTPAQIKAKELVDRYYSQTKHTLRSFPDAWEAAKQCAIICVDEILEQAALLDKKQDEIMYLKGLTFYENTRNVTFWQSVKQAINEL